MKLLFMGTGAADWLLREREAGSFFRRWSALKINNDLMIDCSPDTPDYVRQHKEDLSEISNLLITHTHQDHYSPEAISLLLKHDVRIWSEKNAQDQILHEVQWVQESIIPLFTEVHIGQYQVTAVPANHTVQAAEQIPLHYIIKHQDKTVFWGCDGAWFRTDSWRELKKHRYDLMIFDGTLGDVFGDNRIFEHNNLTMIKEIAAVVRKEKLLTDNGRLMISHLAQFAHAPHEQAQQQFGEFGVGVAYDGMTIEI